MNEVFIRCLSLSAGWTELLFSILNGTVVVVLLLLWATVVRQEESVKVSCRTQNNCILDVYKLVSGSDYHPPTPNQALDQNDNTLSGPVLELVSWTFALSQSQCKTICWADYRLIAPDCSVRLHPIH